MSTSLRDEKWESSSSRPRDVIELMFTCEMMTCLVLPRLGDLDGVGADGRAADPTEAARLLGPEEDMEMLNRCWQRSRGCLVTQLIN